MANPDDIEKALSGEKNLRGADLRGAVFVSVDLSNADLSGANLLNADLSGANLSNADLSGANLSYVYFFRTNLSRANLSGVDLSNVDLPDTFYKINCTCCGKIIERSINPSQRKNVCKECYVQYGENGKQPKSGDFIASNVEFQDEPNGDYYSWDDWLDPRN
tara:strand:+ start:635 stop:1120 length:486 start_codon:yes stop_codon:yes gene_type:complete